VQAPGWSLSVQSSYASCRQDMHARRRRRSTDHTHQQWMRWSAVIKQAISRSSPPIQTHCEGLRWKFQLPLQSTELAQWTAVSSNWSGWTWVSSKNGSCHQGGHNLLTCKSGASVHLSASRCADYVPPFESGLNSSFELQKKKDYLGQCLEESTWAWLAFSQQVGSYLNRTV
jgi:hypothetical protein